MQIYITVVPTRNKTEVVNKLFQKTAVKEKEHEDMRKRYFKKEDLQSFSHRNLGGKGKFSTNYNFIMSLIVKISFINAACNMLSNNDVPCC